MAVEVNVMGELSKVKKTQNPNSLTLNGSSIDQDSLIKKICLNYESFLYAIVIPQGGKPHLSFLDLSPSGKLNLFSQIMDLDLWLEKSELASNRSNEIEKSISAYESDIARLNGQVLSINSTIEDLNAKKDEFDTKKQETIDSLTKELALVTDNIESARAQVTEADLLIAELKPKIRSAETLVRNEETKLSDLSLDIAEANKELALIEHKMLTAKGDQDRLQNVGPFCHMCSQKVDESHLDKELKKLETTLAKLNAEKTEFNLVKKEINADKSKITVKVAELEAAFITLRSKGTKLENNKNALEAEIIYKKREAARIESEIRKTKEQKNEFASMITAKRNELVVYNKKIADKKSEIEKLNEEYTAVSFWISGFKRLRLHIIEETLQTLEIEVNNSLAALGLGDHKIEFDIERENKSGGITSGFVTLITDPKGYTVKYETLSFGETQRAKLAGCFGLADLIMERAGLTSKIEFWDEPSEHMTEAGIQDTLDALYDRAINSGKAIVVVDHHATSYANFAGTFTVIKDENGSRIDESSA